MMFLVKNFEHTLNSFHLSSLQFWGIGSGTTNKLPCNLRTPFNTTLKYLLIVPPDCLNLLNCSNFHMMSKYM